MAYSMQIFVRALTFAEETAPDNPMNLNVVMLSHFPVLGSREDR